MFLDFGGPRFRNFRDIGGPTPRRSAWLRGFDVAKFRFSRCRYPCPSNVADSGFRCFATSRFRDFEIFASHRCLYFDVSRSRRPDIPRPGCRDFGIRVWDSRCLRCEILEFRVFVYQGSVVSRFRELDGPTHGAPRRRRDLAISGFRDFETPWLRYFDVMTFCVQCFEISRF